MKNFVPTLFFVGLAFVPELASAGLGGSCHPYNAATDVKTSALALYCRGFVCVNAGSQFDAAGTQLLNISSIRGFSPPAGENSEQICAATLGIAPGAPAPAPAEADAAPKTSGQN